MHSPKHFHFIGICGTAMGSAAAALSRIGHKVTGSDQNVYPPMSTMLERAGILLMSGFRAENLPADADVIVIGNAMSRGNPEVEAVLDRKLPYTSLPELLRREVLQGRRNFVVTGTHGKTTTTSMLTWLLEHAGKNPGHLIGGVPENFGGGGARFSDSDFFVIEGDEYDTAFFDKRSKFVHYLPEVVIVNNIEFDHADIFGSIDDILRTFSHLLRIVPRNGHVFVNGDEATCRSLTAGCPAPIVTVGTGEDCEFRIRITDAAPQHTGFDLNGIAFRVPMVGEFNVRNAAMAICAARFAGLSDEQIRAAFLEFKGVRRRQTERGTTHGVKIIDDFGHHPTAIRETLRGLRQKYAGARLWALFEPRSNTSRRNLLQNELIEALREADGSIIAAVNHPEKVPAGQLLDVDAVAASLRADGREAYHEPDVNAIVARLQPLVREGDVVVVFSNGGFDGIHQKLLAAL